MSCSCNEVIVGLKEAWKLDVLNARTLSVIARAAQALVRGKRHLGGINGPAPSVDSIQKFEPTLPGKGQENGHNCRMVTSLESCGKQKRMRAKMRLPCRTWT